MKYLVITARHHESFAMWDSKVASCTDTTGSKLYTLPSYTPYKVDVLGALKAECDRQGLRFGLYYSILDWSHSSQTIRHTDTTFSTMASTAARTNYITDMKAQLRSC
jgi:alpha-L-fucosidase